MNVQFKGGRQLEAALMELDISPAMKRGIARRALDKAAEPIRDDWVQGVDVEKGDLRESIKIGNRAQTRTTRKFKRGAGQDIVQRYIGIDASVNPRLAEGGGEGGTKRWTGYAFIEEFGDSGQPANPAGRQAFERNKQASMDRIAPVLWEEIDKAAKRAARKST